MLACTPVAPVLIVEPDAEKRGISLALLASTFLHAVIGLALALWLVPGQQSSLSQETRPLSVRLAVEPPAPPAAATSATEPAPTRDLAPSAPAEPLVTAHAQLAATPATKTPPATSEAGTPAKSESAAAQASSPSVAAVAAGTTTLAVDATIPANTVLDSIAKRGLGMDFPVEVGKLVGVRTAPPIVYPPAALEHKREASILAVVVVDEQGMPYDISLLEFDKEFVDAAQDAIKATRFTPAEDMNGKPIPFFTALRINFLSSTPGSAPEPTVAIPSGNAAPPAGSSAVKPSP